MYERWKNKEEEPEHYVNQSEDINLKTETEKPVPHVDMEITKSIMNMEETKETKGTRELFMETLTAMGCQYELSDEQDDDRIFFAYQGEHFFAGFSDNGIYLHIYDAYWEHVELYDIDEFSRLRKAVNEANRICSVTTFYVIDEDSKTVDVHSKSVIPFMPQIPALADYLRVELNEFFRAHQCVGMEMAKQREKENA